MNFLTKWFKPTKKTNKSLPNYDFHNFLGNPSPHCVDVLFYDTRPSWKRKVAVSAYFIGHKAGHDSQPFVIVSANDYIQYSGRELKYLIWRYLPEPVEDELRPYIEFTQEVATLTVDHKVVAEGTDYETACVYPSDLGKALEKLNKDWLKLFYKDTKF